MTLTKSNIMKTLENNKDLIRQYNVKRIGLFGSFLKNNKNRKGDIDIIVKFNKNTFDDYMDLKFKLEKIFRKKVDLITEESLKDSFKYVKGEAEYVKRL